MLKNTIIISCVCMLLFFLAVPVSIANEYEEGNTIRELYSLASKGQVPGSQPFGVGQKVDDVKKVWGEPDYYNMEEVFGYTKKNMFFTAFEPCNGQLINGVDTVVAIGPIDDPDAIKDISYNRLVEILGVPSRITEKSGEKLVYYDIGEYHLIIFLQEDKIKSYCVTTLSTPHFEAYYF